MGGGGKQTNKQTNKTMSVKYCAVFYLLDFLTFEFGAEKLSQNVRNELPLYGE